MTAPTNETPEERAQRLLGKLGTPSSSKADPAAGYSFDADLIPDVGDDEVFERSETDKQIDSVIDQIDIIDAYVRFCGKMTPIAGRRHESVMISCPNPAHPDKNPSAWLNTERRVWYCGGCQMGGDIYDMAAWHFGFDVPGYKQGSNFSLLRKEIGQAYGVQIVTGINGDEYIVTPDPEPEAAPPPPPAIPPAPPVSNVVPFPTPAPEPEPEPDPDPDPPPAPPVAPADGPLAPAPPVQLPDTTPEVEFSDDDIMMMTEAEAQDLFIVWEEIAPPDTFLHEWMSAVQYDDIALEYYFWEGMQALAFAGSRDVVLRDIKPVTCNLNVCSYGHTGSGKSRAVGPFQKLLKRALPFTATDHYDEPTGVVILPSPGSAESLADSLTFELLDPSTNEKIGTAPMDGLLKIEEFSSFIAKAMRAGSTLKEMLIELYDVHGDDIVIHSRTSGITKVTDPFCQILTTTQPKAIHNYLKKADTESGFLNRFIFSAGRPRREAIPYGGVEINIDDAVLMLEHCRLYASTGHEYFLAGDALEYWEWFFRQNIAKMKSGDIEMESMASRIDLMLKKIIVLLTINSMYPQPTREIVEAACKLFKYLMTGYSMLSRDLAFSDNMDCQNRILIAVETFQDRHGYPPSRREIHRMMGKKWDLELVDRTMKTLCSMQLLEEMASPGKNGKGRPTTRYSRGA